MMRSWLSLVVALGLVAPVQARQNQSPKTGGKSRTKDEPTKAVPIDIQLAKTYFGEARRLADGDGGKLWGKTLAGPILFLDPRSRFAVANQADADGKLKAEGGVFMGTLPSSVPLANTNFRWAGTNWSILLWPPPEDKETRQVMLMHESWHRIQADLGMPLNDPANVQLDTLEGRYWLQLEWRALARALESSDAEQRKAIEDAVRFRQHRRVLFKDAASLENALEANEGIAEFTGIKLGGLTEKEQRRYLIKHLETYPTEFSTYVRSFAYLSGPAYGLLLDQHDNAWLRKFKPGNDLGDVLTTVLTLKLTPEPEAATKERANRYNGSQLWTTEKEREEARLKRVAAFRKILIDGPVLLIPLSKQRMSFNPTQLLPIEGVGTVYPTLTLMGPWGKLEVHKAALMTSDFKKAFVGAPSKFEEKTLSGDGWELQLEPGWKVVKGDRPGDWKLEKAN